jgi:hypothetical protein
MNDRAVQPEAPFGSDAEKLHDRLAHVLNRGVRVQMIEEALARAASQERPRRFAALMETDALSDDRFDYRPEFPNECGWVGALGWADYETPNGRPCTLPDDHEGPHQRNPVGASQERPQLTCPCPDHVGPEDAHSLPGVAQERPRPDTDGALRAALVRLIAAQDVNASVGERMAATTAARAALAGEEQWNNESPESGATATGSSATSAPFATRSGDEPTDCPRCHHESRWHRSGGCVATYRTVDGETPCRCRDLESEVGE